MASRNVVTNIDLAQNNDASVPDSGFTRIKAKVDGDVVVVLPSGEEKSIVNVASTASGFVPTYILPGETFTVPENTQALFRKRIKLGSGARLKLNGILVGV